MLSEDDLQRLKETNSCPERNLSEAVLVGANLEGAVARYYIVPLLHDAGKPRDSVVYNILSLLVRYRLQPVSFRKNENSTLLNSANSDHELELIPSSMIVTAPKTSTFVSEDDPKRLFFRLSCCMR